MYTNPSTRDNSYSYPNYSAGSNSPTDANAHILKFSDVQLCSKQVALYHPNSYSGSDNAHPCSKPYFYAKSHTHSTSDNAYSYSKSHAHPEPHSTDTCSYAYASSHTDTCSYAYSISTGAPAWVPLTLFIF